MAMRALIVAVTIALTALSHAHGASADESSRRAREGVQSGELRPLGQVLAQVTSAYPGRVIDVKLTGSTYRIKVLTASGRVVVVSADGRTGRILGAR